MYYMSSSSMRTRALKIKEREKKIFVGVSRLIVYQQAACSKTRQKW
jgi:hypothetical protein